MRTVCNSRPIRSLSHFYTLGTHVSSAGWAPWLGCQGPSTICPQTTRISITSLSCALVALCVSPFPRPHSVALLTWPPSVKILSSLKTWLNVASSVNSAFRIKPNPTCSIVRAVINVALYYTQLMPVLHPRLFLRITVTSLPWPVGLKG